jgi:hypothetical protein|tara:strand:- start:609 stop:1118 length:510 start_codon:yes stop_codon:yes gene_type:complete
MASTSTNKQPLLVDRVLHEVVDLAGATVETTSVITIGGSNGAKLIVDCTSNDGAIIGEIYSLARQTSAAYTINLYLSSAKDFLRASQASFIGTFNGATTEGSKTVYGGMPYVLNPVPGVGSTDSSLVIGTQFQALYIPKGRAMWAAVKKKTATDTATEAPLLGVHGGFY